MIDNTNNNNTMIEALSIHTYNQFTGYNIDLLNLAMFNSIA